MRSRNHKGNVFVGNLPTDFSDERLAEAFDPFGMVLSAAIAGLNGTQLGGSKLSVQLSEKPVKKPPGAGPRRPPLRTGAPPRMPPRDEDAAAVFPAAPRPQPTFQVERRPLRPLPRRPTPS